MKRHSLQPQHPHHSWVEIPFLTLSVQTPVKHQVGLIMDNTLSTNGMPPFWSDGMLDGFNGFKTGVCNL